MSIKIYVTQPIVPDIDKYIEYIKEIFRVKYFSNNGPCVDNLEIQLREYLKVDYNSAFCNGTTALMIALKSLDLKGTVITTPFTFPATANAIAWNGLDVKFADVDYETMNITPESCLSHIDKDISAVLPVHVFGNACDVDGFDILAKANDLKVVYDAAHAFGTEIDGKGIGTFGDITMFSFHPTKLFHTGEGGMLTYNSRKLDTIIKQLRNFGIQDDITGSIRSGINGKMNEIQAAMGLCILPEIEAEKEKRKEVYNLYKFYLEDISWIKFLEMEKKVSNSLQYFPIRIKKIRNKIYEELKNKNILSRKYFYPLCSDFEHFKHVKSEVPNAVKISEEILCLPFYGDLTIKDIRRICKIIKNGDKK